MPRSPRPHPGLVAAKVRTALDQGRMEGRRGEPPYRFGLIGGWFVRAMEKPGKRGMPAPENFVPPSGGAKTAVLGRFFAAQKEFRDALESAPVSRSINSGRPQPPKGPGGSR